MNKFLTRLTGTLCALSLMASPLIAHASDIFDTGDLTKWLVRFTANQKMEDNLDSSFYDPIENMQPGDTVYFEVAIRNDYNDVTNWYMDNEIVKSLEDYASNTATNGGAYTYTLEYREADGSVIRTLFTNDTVGGEVTGPDGSVGLHQAAENLEAEELQDFGFLGQLNAGESKRIRLTVSLDGETQGNDYQYTMARSRIRFAVNLPEKPGEKTIRRTVRTGDEFNMMPYFAVAFFSGSLLFLICFFRVLDSRKANKEKKGGV